MSPVVDPGPPEPVPPDTAIWRYTALPWFEQLLTNRALWFTRIDCFPKDQWEGQISDAALEMHNQLGLDLDVLAGITEKLRVMQFVNCWTMDRSESSLMWAGYVGPSPGVVIRSTAGRLATSLQPATEFPCQVSKVRYIDYSVDVALDSFNKRSEFEREREVRAAFTDFGQYTTMMEGSHRDDLPKGQSVPVSLANLIDEVRGSPGSGAPFVAEVKNMLMAAGVNVPVRPSELDAPPPHGVPEHH